MAVDPGNGQHPRGVLDPELNQLRLVIQQRSMAAFGEWCDGFSFMLNAAEAGDPQALALLKQVGELLERLGAIRSRIVIPRLVPPTG